MDDAAGDRAGAPRQAVRDRHGAVRGARQRGHPGADAGEPSWAVLGRLLRETRFVQVYRRLSLLRGPLGVMAGNLLKQERGAVADHPYVLYLDSMATPKDRIRPRWSWTG